MSARSWVVAAVKVVAAIGVICTLDVDRYDMKAPSISVATYNALHALQARLCTFELVEKSNRLPQCPAAQQLSLHFIAKLVRSEAESILPIPIEWPLFDMRGLAALCLLAASALVSARSPQHVGKKLPERNARPAAPVRGVHESKVEKRATSPFLNSASEKFVVNGTAIPDVDFDIGESYAGLLPISNATDSPELYFWFFPSPNPLADKEILIWLNGGPGCSSLEGLLQENGPFLWQYGTYAPVENPWTWRNLTNTVWVEQPVGTGFSQGTPTATSETDVASQFLGFFKNFVDTFAMQGYTVYISGESYAGYYVPYIADAMHNKNDKEYYNISSIMIYDPSLSYDSIQEQIPAVPFVDFWGPLIDLNASFLEDIHKRADSCNYTSYLNEYLVFPPKGPLPTPPNVDGDVDGCDLWDGIWAAATWVNPCFDIYQVATTCPLLWDPLGFPGSFTYTPTGADVYFNRSDVQAAINAPPTNWMECTNVDVFVNNSDSSPPSGLSVLPGVIEKNERTIIGHGLLDYILIYNGTLLVIQNMTWNGKQGFSAPPSIPFIVPYHAPSPTTLDNGDGTQQQLMTLAGNGVMGHYHTERGLTLVNVDLSGHMIPQYAPSASYRQLQFLLGRIPALNSTEPFVR